MFNTRPDSEIFNLRVGLFESDFLVCLESALDFFRFGLLERFFEDLVDFGLALDERFAERFLESSRILFENLEPLGD